MKKQSIGSCQSLVTSPRLVRGCEHLEKGWCSERIPIAFGSDDCTNRRKQLSTQTSPCCSGRPLPSKWEDAERWIGSPILGHRSVAKNSYVQPPSQNAQQETLRRPKAKSGPILAPVLAPSATLFELGAETSSSVRNVLVDGVSPPFTTGVFMPFGVGGIALRYAGKGGNCSSFPPSRDEKSEVRMGEPDIVSGTVSRRDIATQMSPASSPESSSWGMRSPSPPPSLVSVVETKKEHETKMEVREVRVDNGSYTTTNAQRVDMICGNAIECCSWDASEAISDFSKQRRKEAKIVAWENMQKAKAEAAIRKLEMKLEKKRSSAMEKIIRRLRNAQSKAKEMRTSITETEDDNKPKMIIPITCAEKHSKFCLLYSCFTSKAI